MNTNPETSARQTERKDVLEALYRKAFPLVARHISKSGGTLEEAKDVFHDALVIYMEKTAVSDIEITHSEQSYILGIAKHLWSKNSSQNKRQAPQNGIQGELPLPEDGYSEVETSKLLELLKSTGQKCLELLSSFYYEKLDMERLAGKFGFSGARSATVQKHKCLEKIKNTVKVKSLQYDDFLG